MAVQMAKAKHGACRWAVGGRSPLHPRLLLSDLADSRSFDEAKSPCRVHRSDREGEPRAASAPKLEPDAPHADSPASIFLSRCPYSMR